VCEGDSLQVIQEICDLRSLYVRIGHYVEAIRQNASRLSFCYWVYCCREANDIVHVLAREASSMSICLVLFLMFLMETFWFLDCNLVIFY
jgi:hypothetical protein